MLKTLKITFALRIAYKINSILFALKQLPLIKRLLPASLYSAQGLKTFAGVLAVLWEVLSAFLGKFLYFLLMLHCILTAPIYSEVAPNALFLHAMLFLTLIGALTNTYIFDPTRERYYAVILMRMDAKANTLVTYGYAMAKILVGFALFGLLYGQMAGLPIWQCLVLPVFTIGLKTLFCLRYIRNFKKTGDAFNENRLGKYQWLAILFLLAAAYGLPCLGLTLPVWASLSLMILSVAGGAFSARQLIAFDDYRAVHQQIQTQQMQAVKTAKSAAQIQSQKSISADTTITSSKHGMEFLNELFIKRHRKLLWKLSRRITLVCAALVAVVLVLACFFPGMASGMDEIVLNCLPYMAFVLYFVNRGTGFTTALFMNCDHSLLTYSFYKEPKWILRLFRIRLWEITKVNLLPAVIIGVGLDLILLVSGGAVQPVSYVIFPAAIISMSVFFSVHYLTLYYLLQPYNAGTEMKSAAYRICISLTYVVCYLMATQVANAEIGHILFGSAAIVFCVMYSVIACILVYRLAPKTFRIRT